MELKGCIPWICAVACLECSSESQTPCASLLCPELQGLHVLKGQILWNLCKAPSASSAGVVQEEKE